MNNLEILCSIQRALIGHVTSNLRAAYVSINRNIFYLTFYYDNPASDEEEELSSLVHTEFVSDFPAPDFQTDFAIYTFPYPKIIPDNGQCVYKRFEKK